MCETCKKVRKAAFAVIRTVVRAVEQAPNEKTSNINDEGGGASKVSGLRL